MDFAWRNRWNDRLAVRLSEATLLIRSDRGQGTCLATGALLKLSQDLVTSNTRFSGAGPNDGHATTPV